jgi:hypothetical protein
VKPHITHTESKYYGTAWRATVTRDRACSGFAGPTFTTGSPSRALTSRFSILRRPATPADKLPALLHHNLPPQRLPGGEAVYNWELYLNQIRLARSAFGASFYVIPAGNVTTQREVPARCGPEQAAALKRRLSHSHLPRGERGRILAAQARYLAYLRYLALHPEGICASYFPSHARKFDVADNLPNCATLADFGRWGVLVDASVYLDHAAVFWTVVPDGVARVTLRFTQPNGRPLATTAVRPVNNVVVAREPYDAPYQSGFPTTIVLRAADGHEIKNITVTPNMPTLCGYGC